MSAIDPPEDDDLEPGQPGIPVEWAVDAAIGAASTAGRMAAAVGRSVPGRIATAATRFIATPLTEEGHEVRERAAPAAKEAIQHVTPDVVEAIDLNTLLDTVDLNRLLDRIDIGAIVAKVDVNALVADVDIQGIIDRVDIDGIIEQVDIDALLDRIDMDSLLERIDLNAVIGRVDVDSLLTDTELGSIIAQSTTGVASEALDAVRRQGVSLDNVVARLSRRLVRRDPEEYPAGPALLVEPPRALPPGDSAPEDPESSS